MPQTEKRVSFILNLPPGSSGKSRGMRDDNLVREEFDNERQEYSVPNRFLIKRVERD